MSSVMTCHPPLSRLLAVGSTFTPSIQASRSVPDWKIGALSVLPPRANFPFWFPMSALPPPFWDPNTRNT